MRLSRLRHAVRPGRSSSTHARLDSPRDVLDRVDELCDAGRLVEAVDLLTEANRELRSPALERRQRMLRYRAFDHLTREPGEATWPPTAEDVFPEAQGIPEISPGDLDAASLRSGIINRGALIVRGLLDVGTVERIVAGIDEAIAMGRRSRDGAPESETMPWYSPFDPDGKIGNEGGRNFVLKSGGVYTADSPRMLFDVIETIRSLGVVDAIAGHLGERPALSVKKSTLRTVSPDSNTNWHQDGAFLGEGVRSTNLWVALSDCGEDAPTLDIVPKRLRALAPCGTHGAIFDWSVGHDLVEEIAGEAGIARLHFRAGDAIFFDDLNLHRTAVSDSMTKNRYAIESWFFAPSTYPVNQVPLVI